MSNVQRSSILFSYDGRYYQPNGDPYTGDQRFDEVTCRVLVSDERIKRYIRDHILDINKATKNTEHEIFVREVTPEEEALVKASGKGDKETSSALRLRVLQCKYPGLSVRELLQKCIDNRLFGCIATVKANSSQGKGRKSKKSQAPEAETESEVATKESAPEPLTGPVQFAILNPSLNKVDLRPHQITSVFKSDTDNQQGAIGTSYLVPYSVNQIVGWVSPLTAMDTGLTEEEVIFMLKCLWDGINNKNTRSKSNQRSLLALKINYKDVLDNPIDGLDELVSIKAPNEEDIRSLSDYTFDFTKLKTALESDTIVSVDYRCTKDRKSVV